MNKILQIYTKIHQHYGNQNWWPVTDENGIIPTYKKREALTKKQKLEICFGAILTQNTNWKNVEKAIIKLNERKLFDIKKIIRIEEKKLAEVIRSSGYHNQKAIKLKNFCEFFLNNYNGDFELFFKKDISELRDELLSVNGIGPETADSIMLYAAQKPIFVIDAYTKRIFSRLGFNEEKYNELQKLFMENLENRHELFNEYHALIVELGKNICKTRPICAECPLNRMCMYHKGAEGKVLAEINRP